MLLNLSKETRFRYQFHGWLNIGLFEVLLNESKVHLKSHFFLEELKAAHRVSCILIVNLIFFFPPTHFTTFSVQPKAENLANPSCVEYRLFFLRSSAQFFTEIYMNGFVSSYKHLFLFEESTFIGFF